MLTAAILLAVAVALLSTSGQRLREGVPVVTSYRSTDAEPIGHEYASRAVADERGARTELRAQGTPRATTRPQTARLHGRVVDAFDTPVTNATVTVHFQYAGLRKRRRLPSPKPPVTAHDGTFICQAPRLPNLLAVLHVESSDHASGRFERSLGERSTDFHLGDLVVDVGSEVRGRVTNEHGLAIPEAQVRIHRQYADPVPRLHDRGQAQTATTTDSAGCYRLAHVADGDWLLTVNARRYQDGRSPVFSVAEGSSTELADIRLCAGHELVGFVTDVSRRVIANAEVRLLAPNDGQTYLTRSDVDGRFLFRHLPATPLILTANADGYLCGEQHAVQGGVRPGPLSITLRDGLRIDGSVTDLVTGRVVTEYAVSAIRLGDLSELGSQRAVGGDIGRVESHPEGRFSLHGQQEGVYLVAVQSPDHQRWHSRVIRLRKSAGTTEVTAALVRGSSVRGHVIDEQALALAGAHIELRAVNVDDVRGRRGVPISCARTDGRGSFTIQHMPAGDYEVLATAANHDQKSSGTFELNGDVEGIMLELAALGSLEGRVLGVSPSNRVPVRVLAVPAGVRQRAAACDGRLTARVAGDGTYRFRRLASGPYHVRAFVGSPADVVRELSPRPGSATRPPDVAVSSGATALLDIQIRLPQPGMLFGAITDNGRAADRYHVELARVDDDPNESRAGVRWVGFGDGGQTATTDSSGRYTLAQVPPGRYVAKVTGDDDRAFPLTAREVVIAAGYRMRADFSLATSPIRGRVSAVSEPGLGLLLGEVSFLPGLTELPAAFDSWRRSNKFVSAPIRDGEFASGALPPGQYLVVLDLPGRERVIRSLSLYPGQTLMLELQAGSRR